MRERLLRGYSEYVSALEIPSCLAVRGLASLDTPSHSGYDPLALSRKRLPPGETPVRIRSCEISSEALIARDTILLGRTSVLSVLRALQRSEEEGTPGRNFRQAVRGPSLEIRSHRAVLRSVFEKFHHE